MRRFLARLLEALITLWLLATLCFVLLRAAPGGPFDTEKSAPPEVQAALAAQYRLDQPLIAQYGAWLGDVARGVVDQIMVPLLQPRRADDDRCLRSDAGVERRFQRPGRSEIDDHIGVRRQSHDIAALVDTAARLPGLRNRGGERDAHPSLTADDADARHDASPYPIPLSASDRAKSRHRSPRAGRIDENG